MFCLKSNNSLQEITRTDCTERPIRLSPRRRAHLRDHSKQQSLDIASLSTNRNHMFFKQGSLDSKVEEILESYSNGGNTKRFVKYMCVCPFLSILRTAALSICVFAHNNLVELFVKSYHAYLEFPLL